jgi:hypothetical protein
LPAQRSKVGTNAESRSVEWQSIKIALWCLAGVAFFALICVPSSALGDLWKAWEEWNDGKLKTRTGKHE